MLGSSPMISVACNLRRSQVRRVMIHEMTHGLQICSGMRPDPRHGCVDCLKGEMEAYNCAGLCSNADECFDRAAPSCRGYCGQDGTEYLRPVLRKFFNQKQGGFCDFKKPL